MMQAVQTALGQPLVIERTIWALETAQDAPWSTVGYFQDLEAGVPNRCCE